MLQFDFTTHGILMDLTGLRDRYGVIADIGLAGVLTPREAAYGIKAGAHFIPSPTADLWTIRAATSRNTGVIAGAAQVIELAAAMAAGASAVEFAAGSLQPALHWRAPTADVGRRRNTQRSGRPDAAAAWLTAGAVAISAGSWLMGDASSSTNLVELRRRCRAVQQRMAEAPRRAQPLYTELRRPPAG